MTTSLAVSLAALRASLDQTVRAPDGPRPPLRDALTGFMPDAAFHTLWMRNKQALVAVLDALDAQHNLDPETIARALMETREVVVERHGFRYYICANEDGYVYGFFEGSDEGDPAATGCFGQPEEDDFASHMETAREIVAWAQSPLTFNDYAAIVHRANRKWWISVEDGYTRLKRNKGELLMLIVSEIAEAMEGERKDLWDDKLPHRKMAEVELVDALIRIFDYAGAHHYDLAGAYAEKMAYNAVREDHTHEARRIAGGKQF